MGPAPSNPLDEVELHEIIGKQQPLTPPMKRRPQMRRRPSLVSVYKKRKRKAARRARRVQRLRRA